MKSSWTLRIVYIRAGTVPWETTSTFFPPIGADPRKNDRAGAAFRLLKLWGWSSVSGEIRIAVVPASVASSGGVAEEPEAPGAPSITSSSQNPSCPNCKIARLFSLSRISETQG